MSRSGPDLPYAARRGSDRCAAVTSLATLVAVLAGPVAAEERAASPSELLARARSWGYLLQNVDSPALGRTTYDVLVVDAGSGDGRYGLEPGDVARLKQKPDSSRRLVIAYMNVGEAEDYRYYWRPTWKSAPPAWMGTANCRWKGDHRVRHWAAEWQALLFGSKASYLGRLIAAGYDGVYLDRVDIFYHWRATRWQAAADMVDFVARLSAWAKKQRPGFLVLPQNGEELLSDPRYLAAIDGIGKEDMLYGDRGNDVANASARILRAERNFAPAIAARLPVFAVEYARRPEHHAEADRRLKELGFKIYFAPRSLAYLGQDGPPHPEDGDTETVAAEDDQGSCP